MRRLKFFLLFFLSVVLIVAAIRLVQTRKHELDSVQGPEKPVLTVSTVRVRGGELDIVRSYRGEIKPERTIHLTPRIQGRIKEINGHAGDGFGPDTMLVQLESEEIRANVRALEAQKDKIKHRLWFLQRTSERQKGLVGGAVSREQYERIVSDMNQARSDLSRVKNELDAVRTRLGYSRLQAGFPGRIQTRLQEPGDMAQPGQGILLLEDKSAGYNVRIQVPAEVQSDLEPGRKLTLFRGNDTLQTEISRIYPASVSPSPLIPVEAHLKHPPFGLPGGASIETRLGQGQMQGLIVPSRAVLEQGEKAFVFRVDDDSRVRAVAVSIRGRNRDRVLIRGELKPEDEVAIGPRSLLTRLSPGLLVRRAEASGS